jgi:hypothetical protein
MQAVCKQAGHITLIQITDYKLAPRGAPVNGANLGSMGTKLSTKLINKLIIIRRKCISFISYILMSGVVTSC